MSQYSEAKGKDAGGEILTKLKQRIEMVMQHTKPNSRCFRVIDGNHGSGSASSPPSQLLVGGAIVVGVGRAV